MALVSFAQAFSKCGGTAPVASFLQKVGAAGSTLLAQRARNGTATTTLIIQHYPGQCSRDVFEDALPASRKNNSRVICAYGHTHDQKCNGEDEDGTCNDVLTGGGGGCCGPEVNLAGFTSVFLKDDGGYTLDVDSAQVRMHGGQCKW